MSSKKISASRLNGQRSCGPKNTTSTRFNATKHGLLAAGITELDDAEGYQTILSDLMRERNPVGATETYLVKAAALEMVRWLRARRLEAEYITAELNPPLQAPGPLADVSFDLPGGISDPGLPAAISPESTNLLVTIFQRYESFFANRLFRILHELERLQRMRQGERLPAPVTVNVNVHADKEILDSVPPELGQQKGLSGDGESVPAPVMLDVSVHAKTGTVDSAPAAPEQPKVRPADGESLPAADAVDVNVHADTGIVDSVPAALEQPKALPGAEE